MKVLLRVFVLTRLCLPSAAWAWQVPQLSSRRQQPTTTPTFRARSSSPEDDNVDPVLRIPLMEAELAVLSNSGDIGGREADETTWTDRRRRRIELEESLGDARTAAEFGVRRAQVQFYEAFSNGDLSSMAGVWSEDDDVRCVHPGMPCLEGRNDVMRSWEQLMGGDDGEGGGAFVISPSRARIDVCGRTAICSCIEETPNGGKLEAINVYRREDGSWRMILHMASPIIQMGSAL